MKQTLTELHALVLKKVDPEKAVFLKRFFKTGSGEYGEGDTFAGIKVPESRKIAKQFHGLVLEDTLELLHSKIHEERLISLFLLVEKFKKSDEAGKLKIAELYAKNASLVNNWDLVDSSAHFILGAYFFPRKNVPLFTKFAKSKNLWERRIAMIATYYYIRNGEFDEPLRIAKLLIRDDHDLIHKAVGWMLREVGNRDLKTEVKFLKQHYKTMPRTALRYAIEKFPKETREKYLKGKYD